MDDFEWAKETVNNIPVVYAVYYTGVGGDNDLEGYFTIDAFDRYLMERNQEREEMGEEPEEKDDFTFKRIDINW